MFRDDDVPRIVQDVKDRLSRKSREKDVHFRLEDQDYHLEDDWLYLSVAPIREGIRPDDYAQVLGEIEAELRNEGIDNVLLIPSMADKFD